MYFHRILEKEIIKISNQFPAILLTGPRQVAKTTLLKYLAQDKREYITLDDFNLFKCYICIVSIINGKLYKWIRTKKNLFLF